MKYSKMSFAGLTFKLTPICKMPIIDEDWDAVDVNIVDSKTNGDLFIKENSLDENAYFEYPEGDYYLISCIVFLHLTTKYDHMSVVLS